MILKEISLQGKDGVVFKNLEGEMVRDNAVRSAFNAGFKALGLPWKATHICRHTWGTLGLKANGDNISKVQMNMGHSDRRVSEIYAKAHAQADSSTIIKTAELMGFLNSFDQRFFNSRTNSRTEIKKTPEKLMFTGVYDLNGGESGIRTHGRLLTYNGFQDRRLKPLGHLSSMA